MYAVQGTLHNLYYKIVKSYNNYYFIKHTVNIQYANAIYKTQLKLFLNVTI